MEEKNLVLKQDPNIDKNEDILASETLYRDKKQKVLYPNNSRPIPEKKNLTRHIFREGKRLNLSFYKTKLFYFTVALNEIENNIGLVQK